MTEPTPTLNLPEILAAHARWLADPTTPPAPEPGEVGSAAALATWLRNHSGQCVELGRPDWAHMADRAADTLEAFRVGGWVVPTVEDAPPAPEPGDVGELVAVLQVEARSVDICGNTTVITAAELRRAAALLQQLSAPAPAVVPVPVAERPWEREGWCDAKGWCWWFEEIDTGWVFDAPPRIWAQWSLPAHAIPLPQAGEGES